MLDSDFKTVEELVKAIIDGYDYYRSKEEDAYSNENPNQAVDDLMQEIADLFNVNISTDYEFNGFLRSSAMYGDLFFEWDGWEVRVELEDNGNSIEYYEWIEMGCPKMPEDGRLCDING